MFKEIKSGKDAKKAMLSGMKKLADAVGSTLGPNGSTVVLCEPNKEPHVTKDGVSVAKEIEFADFFENAGAQLLREAAVRTLNTVGDSTTTSTILGYTLCDALYHSKLDKAALKKGIKDASNKIVDYIKSHSIAIKDEQIKDIATISANNDTEIGSLIADAFDKIGRDGIITVEESKDSKTTVDVVSGMQFDRGYVVPHFVTDTTKDQCVLENPYILITEHHINNLREIKNILTYVLQENRPLLIIAEAYDDAVIEALKVNVLNNTIKCCAITAPSYGEYRKMILTDLGILTNGFNVSYDCGIELCDCTESVLGTCKRVVVTKDKTTITEGNGKQEHIDDRVKDLKAELQRIQDDPTQQGGFMETFLKERIAKLTGGICIIHVGGKTELEMVERKDRIDDAVCATQAAIEEGIVPGGGLMYLHADDIFSDTWVMDEISSILNTVLLEPITRIIESSGKAVDVVFSEMGNNGPNAGFDGVTGKVVPDMIKAGIIDPAKAVRLAFENAASIGLLFLDTEYIVAPQMAQSII